MCLVTEQKRVKILKEDLIVYKLFEISGDGISPWSGVYAFNYKVGKTHHQPLTVDNIPSSYHDITVGKAYGFININEGKAFINNPIAVKLTHIHEGFHSALTLKRLSYTFDCFECTIPKGSRVFMDKTGLVVSDTIILNKRIA